MKHPTRRSVLIGATSALACPAFGQTANSDAAAFFKGKTIRLLVGSPPGGGYDLYARMILPYLAKRLEATVLVENRDGNGGLMALNYLMNRPADGLSIMHASAEAAFLSQVLQRDGVVWDVTKLKWLARTSAAPKLWFVGNGGKVQSVAAAMKASQLVWSSTGPADNISDVAAVISDALGLKSRIVVGYRGAGDMSLAVIRNEADSGVLSGDSAYSLVTSNQVKPLAILADKRWPRLPDVPTLFEIGSIPEEKKWLLDFRQQVGEAQRAMVVAPETPTDRVEYLRAVFADVLADAALIEEGSRTNREINFMPGADMQALLGKLMRTAQPNLTAIRKVMLDSYF